MNVQRYGRLANRDVEACAEVGDLQEGKARTPRKPKRKEQSVSQAQLIFSRVGRLDTFKDRPAAG